MTLPPNRIGASRGPGGATLDDVVAAINGLIAVQQEQAITLESMRNFLSSITTAVDPNIATILTRLTYLTGSAAPNGPAFGTTGLPGYLTAVHGSRQQANSLGGNLFDWSYLSYNEQSVILQALYGDFANQGATNTIWRIYQELLTLSDSLGVRGASEVNLSALGYLALISSNTQRAADCCEDNGSVDPDPGETQPPTGEDACAIGITPYRATGYFFRQNLPAEELDEYIVRFEGIDGASGGDVFEFNSQDTTPLPVLGSSLDMAYCFEWNLLSGQVPAQIAKYESGSDNNFTGAFSTLYSVAIGAGSGGVEEVDAGDGAIIFCVRVPEGAGEPDHLNYWLRWEAVPS